MIGNIWSISYAWFVYYIIQLSVYYPCKKSETISWKDDSIYLYIQLTSPCKKNKDRNRIKSMTISNRNWACLFLLQ